MRECIEVATIQRQPDDVSHKTPNRTRRFPPGNTRTRMLRLLVACVSAAALTVLSIASASAQANWTGATSNDWTVGTNWTTGAAPTPGQAVNIGILGAPPLGPTVLGVGGAVSVSVGTTLIGNSGAT